MVAGKGTWATNDVITATGLNSGYDSSGNIKLTAAEKIVDANDNEIVEFTQTGSAVNNIKIANAATGYPASIIHSGEATGILIEGVTVNNTQIGINSNADFTINNFNAGNGNVKVGRVGTGTLAALNDETVGGKLTVTGAFGCNAKTAQTAYASGGALTYTGQAYGNATQTSYLFASDTDFNALKTLVNNIRAALVANGIMS